jgi:sodium transport system permease protein
MRWSIIRVIWFRELRDQLRDRRTIFMIAVLPILLYPLLGLGVAQFFLGSLGRPNVIGVLGGENLDPIKPPLLIVQDGETVVDPRFLDDANDENRPEIVLLNGSPPTPPKDPASVQEWLKRIGSTLPEKEKRVDVILVVPPTFAADFAHGIRSTVYIAPREQDHHSRLVEMRLNLLLFRWKQALTTVRLEKAGLPSDYDDAFKVWDPEQGKPQGKRLADDLFKILTTVFPFVLVLWSLAGALYPAVDLCAGEKERGTMETLLISPASREEIVWGKFLTIWVFSAATALLNLLSMGLTTWQFSSRLVQTQFHLGVLLWGVLLLLPLSAFFSALCLAVGVYARSSKEGQYYLMPLFLITMPLIFLTLMPGIVLNPFYSMVPVTGVALLLQALMVAGTPEARHWLYFVPVLAPMIIYSWLALRWAIEQFQREEVLFREAERLDIGLWFKTVFRDKEPFPSIGQSLFCFALILGLRWLTMVINPQATLLVTTAIVLLAFVAAPTLFMALLLTTRPIASLGFRIPPWWAWPAAVVLGVLITLPFSELTLYILGQFPMLKDLIAKNNPVVELLKTLDGNWFGYFLVIVVLPGVCEELAFRGFILGALQRRFAPWTAIFISSFLFAIYQMNVFSFAPQFILGFILGFLVLRTRSVLPAMVFRLIYNFLILLILPRVLDAIRLASEQHTGMQTMRLDVVLLCTILALGVLYGVWRFSRWETPPA